MLFIRETGREPHLEFNIENIKIKCGYTDTYKQGTYLKFHSSFSKKIFFTGAFQHNVTPLTTGTANFLVARHIELDKISFSYISPNGTPLPQTTIMWIAIGI